METLLIILALAALVAWLFIAPLWMVVHAYRIRPALGLVTLVFPPMYFYLLLAHWDRMKKPFLLCIAGFSLFCSTLMGVHYLGFENQGPAAPASAEAAPYEYQYGFAIASLVIFLVFTWLFVKAVRQETPYEQETGPLPEKTGEKPYSPITVDSYVCPADSDSGQDGG